MISLILPYWDRQEAADKAFKTLEQYKYLDLEIVVVDDGNKVPFRIPEVPLNIRVINLTQKSEPKSPCTAWNEGVKAAKGDIVILSCIEILHEKPVLQALADELIKLGKKGYTVASTWCPEEGRWHCHSTLPVPTCPQGVGISFCTAIYKDFYIQIGGFDEDYREGAGYEDRDFIWKLTKAGAKFKMCDELQVIHPKSGASIIWGAEKFARNEALYFSKWDIKKLNIVCVNAGNYLDRGAEYVNILHDMVKRNMPAVPYRFICFTDDERGLDKGIEVRNLPNNLTGWMNKVYLFKKGVFKDGERVFYLDLDTIITGNLERIIQYQGKFATLRDFYRPEGLGPAVMMWEAGKMNEIWEKYCFAGYPELARGDQEWLESYFTETPDILQDLYPEKFVSYKKDCLVNSPSKAAVVCFHGLPRPHQVNGWVSLFWKKDGCSSSDFEIVCNTEISKVKDNIAYSSNLDLPWLELKPENKQRIIICGGAPSLESSLDEIRNEWESGSIIVGLNGSAQYLLDNYISPDWLVLIDSRPENVEFILDYPAKEYFLASQCNPEIFNMLDSEKVTLFHIDIPNIGEYVAYNDKPIQAIGGGSTVGLMAMSLAYTQGFRDIHLYGFDSSYEENAHVYPQEQHDELLEVVVSGRTFQTCPWMVTQVNQFQELANQLRALGCQISVHGEGLLPYLAWCMMAQSQTTLEN